MSDFEGWFEQDSMVGEPNTSCLAEHSLRGPEPVSVDATRPLGKALLRSLLAGVLSGIVCVGGFEIVRSASSRPAAEAPVVALEAQALDRVHEALARGDAAQALSDLNAYEVSFPDGARKLEATALRIRSLFEAGNELAARSLASRFLAEHPEGPNAAEVRSLLLARREAASTPAPRS